jgi:hypothetical protein
MKPPLNSGKSSNGWENRMSIVIAKGLQLTFQVVISLTQNYFSTASSFPPNFTLTLNESRKSRWSARLGNLIAG